MPKGVYKHTKQCKGWIEKRRKTLKKKMKQTQGQRHVDAQQELQRANPMFTDSAHHLFMELRKTIIKEKDVYCNGKVYN